MVSVHLLALRSPTVPEIVLGLALAVMIFAFWRLTRHQECGYSEVSDLSIRDALQPLAGLTHGHVFRGNQVELIQDAAFFDAIEAGIRDARRTVHLETFLWHHGEAADRVAAALAEAACRGLAVRVLLDAGGTFRSRKAAMRRMREAGCDVRRFHRLRVGNLGRLNIRDHRKIIVLDGRIAFVGGHCVTDHWLKDQEDFPRFRDITARITGPVVADVQSCFFENWTEVTGELLNGPGCFPELEPTGDVIAHVAYVKPDQTPSSVQVLHHLAIGHAKRRIRMQNPYFIPGRSAVKALASAARRGVDVRLMVPALKATDSPLATRAGHRFFRLLLEAGVRIFAYQPTLLHQKVLVVDGIWAGLGSSNFDDRSFEINDEITIGYADERIARELEDIFERDRKQCEEITLDTWNRRPWREKFLSAAVGVVNEQL